MPSRKEETVWANSISIVLNITGGGKKKKKKTYTGERYVVESWLEYEIGRRFIWIYSALRPGQNKALLANAKATLPLQVLVNTV